MPVPKSTIARLSRLPRPALIAAVAVAVALARQAGPGAGRLLDEKLHHLGNDKTPEWKESTAEPESAPLTVEFESKANATEWLLELEQRDVGDDWTLALNGKPIGSLRRSEDRLRTFRYPVPAGTLVDGKNALTVTSTKTPAGAQPTDDVLVGRFRLHEKSLRELFALGRLVVHVSDATTLDPLPARVTLADAKGERIELFYAEARTTAVRPGIAYTSDGVVALEAPAGIWTVYASRGMEWSLAKAQVEIKTGQTQEIALALRREVDTTGWVAADTHIHTLTFSGHGDASVEERVVTIAGEGIELAVATDHNHHTDLAPAQRALHLEPFFTPVIGNEVTTDNGHMNAFPFATATPVPESRQTDWAKLVEGIRARGAEVVILNHPRWPDKHRDPLSRFGFDERTGGNAAGQRFTFDCLELMNSDAPTQPTPSVLAVWYALLDRGLRFPGVGASDSHHVGVIVGQGRTYVPSATDDPAQIDVAAAIRAIKEGRVSVSHGLFATIEVDGRAHMGDTLAVQHGNGRDRTVDAVVNVRHPSWVKPARLDLVVDGAVAASVELATRQAGDTATSRTRRARVPLPAHDSWLVAVAWGEGVALPCWATELAETCAITNPIWLDADGDGRCDSPRALAQALIDASRSGATGGGAGNVNVAALTSAIASVDDAVAFQLLDLLRESMGTEGAAALAQIAAGAGAQRPALSAWVAQPSPAPTK